MTANDLIFRKIKEMNFKKLNMLAKLIAKKTMRIVYENIIFALLVKFIILTLSAFGIANIWIAVFGDVGVALICILNALRSGKIKNIE